MPDTQIRRVSNPPKKPVVLYDGNCGFCRFWVERWNAIVRGSVDFEPLQQEGARYPGIPREQMEREMQLVDADGTVLGGADAVLRMWRGTRWGWLETLAKKVPPLLGALRAGYRFVAGHRTLFSRLTRLGWGDESQRPTFAVARRVFAHALGLVFLAAFGSLLVQWRGLIGSGGILPVAKWMEPAHEHFGSAVYLRLPTIFWAAHGDGVLMTAAVLGVLLSLVLCCGVLPGPMSLALWGLYLSFCAIGSPFFNFQWDALLLETALLAAIFLPWNVFPQWRLTTRVTTVGRWLLWWLLARLMLESAVVKLSSGDPTWRNLTAMSYHFETQPLPLWTAWHVHQAPMWMHKLEAFGTFAIEFLAPLLIFGPRRFRHAGAWLVILLQCAIMATGNYAFFNLLTIALSLLLLEDTHWPTWVRRRLMRRVRPPLHLGGATWSSWIMEPVGVLIFVVTAALLVRTFDRTMTLPSPIAGMVRLVQPLNSFNSYGLFAVMTTERREIVVEGSSDGEHWQPYEFKWKPGDLNRRPQLVAPHQPRLDWQMWFAALSDYQHETWFMHFLERLLTNAPDVLGLMEWNPFPGTPPRYVRAVIYQYHFTRYADGPGWWKRDHMELYCPPVSLKPAS